MVQQRTPLLRRLLEIAIVVGFASAALDCDPSADVKKPDPDSPEFYLYCNLEGTFSRNKCHGDKIFSNETKSCVSPIGEDQPSSDDPFSFAHFQAPDDLCGNGIPLTILSAPVACNPSISSCPDGYVCRMYERSGTSYCCQNMGTTNENSASCSADQVTYVEPSTGRPRSCVLSSESSCPVGFGCNLVGGSTTRCCGKDFGCPFNSAAFLNPNTGSHVECSPGSVGECQRGFVCVLSAMFNKHICCSAVDQDDRNMGAETLSAMLNAQCPNGEPALASPSSCNADRLCPTGYICTDGKCCPSVGVCPAGQPLGGGLTVCSPENPCQEGYECTTTGGVQYCCPSRTRVCGLPRNSGVECATARAAVTRYFFDSSTGSCRSFQFSRCGGNANNFNSLDECEGFCLDRQCAAGQPYRVGAVNAACAPRAASSCPRQFVCQPPLFGTASICCPSPELTCNEMVSAGTPCFGRSMTMQRFYFNPNTRRCQPFQYYGCNGNGNNFESLEACDNFCLNAIDSVCGGVSPLYNPNNEVQRCSNDMPCPHGYACNGQRYCCPTAQIACGAPVSRGNVCAGSPQRSLWHFDSATQKCRQFTYNGCGGTANRFTSQSACSETCVKAGAVGQCPRGMNAYVDNGDVAPKTCTLNVMGTCPPSASCVRSTTNRPICCQVVTTCPEGRIPYNIPGSTSVVSCSIDGNDCPTGNVCAESSSVSGFYMCCSVRTGSNSLRPGKKPSARERVAQSLKDLSPCPPGLETSGDTCKVNQIGACGSNELCFKEPGYKSGICCKSHAPKCATKGFIPRYISKHQVQLCQSDLPNCPSGSRCMTSNIPTVAICCQQYNHPGRPVATTMSPHSLVTKGVPDMANPLCRNSEIPFKDNFGKVHVCNFFQNSCPLGYKCEFSNTGQPVCCNDVESIRCPAGSSSFEFGGRPLACPAGSTRCPNGYACTPSLNPRYHLCCSTGSNLTPQCTRGVAYLDPVTSLHQGCSPLSPISCPNGFHCLESTQAGHFICCTSGDITASYRGFCPPRQLPHIGGNGSPTTCHMTLHPCPNTAPYVCIYSAERQDSFCCAPIDTAVRTGNSITLRSSPGHAIPSHVGGVLGSSATAMPPNPLDVLPVGGCPAGTRPLVDHFRSVVECGIRPCPDGFACVYSPTESRWQCCSAGSILLKSIAPPPPSPVPSPATETTNPKNPNDPSTPILECPYGFSLIDGKCIKVLYVGQKGCTSDVQCSTREENATCDSGYCICPESRPLVHSGKCVADCPAGFANIAGRCYDPTTVIFMDSVDERANGTIGGFCMDTVIEEKRCIVENAYCSEKTITCTCKPGHELKMDFKNKKDQGSCVLDPSSKYATDADTASDALLEPMQEDGELYFVDIGPPPSPAAPSKDDDSLSEGSGEDEATAPKEDAEDIDRYLFQSDHMVGVFA